MISIAIDGPSGSGKSTVSKCLSEKLGFASVDTGALYRAVAYFLSINKINFEDEATVENSLENMKIDLKYQNGNQKIFLNGKDVTEQLRSEEISMISSKVSAMPCVRKFLLYLQKNLALTNNVIMDGRDIGTVVLPNADVKIFLTAPAEVRAKRRYLQLLPKNPNANFQEILKSVNERDFNDKNRKISPLKCADDAVVFDNSDYTLDETIDALLNLIKEQINIEAK